MRKISILASALLFLGIGVSQAQITNIHNFASNSYMYCTPIQSGNVLYGMTSESGVNGYGSIFSVNTDGSNYKDLLDFADTGSTAFHCNGDYPYGSLTLLGNTLFGTTYLGGLHGDGTVFSIHTDGSGYRDLWDFADTGTVVNNYSGYRSESSLTAIGGKLFGTTYEGGFNADGTLFRIDTSYTKDTTRIMGGYKDLWDFHYNSDSNGAYPYTVTLQVSPSKKVLYGAAYEGGVNDKGCVFSIDTNGAHYKNLHNFGSGGDGYYPYSSVLLAGAKLYGMTYEGGGYGYGTIYSLDTNGTNYMALYDFGGTNGEYPYGDLTIAGNMMYGMTEAGGTNGYGTIFSIDTVGNNFTNLFNFDYYTYGEEPEANLLLSNGSVYGTTYDGGSLDGGTLFRYDLCGSSSVMVATTADNGTGNGTAMANATGGPTPYTYMWSPGGQTSAMVTGLSARTYTVTVTSANGCITTSTATVQSTEGIHNLTANSGINVYPNPNNSNFTVALSGTLNNATFKVYDMLGQEVFSHSLTLGDNVMNMNTRSNGVYMYRIISGNGNLAGQGRLIIQK